MWNFRSIYFDETPVPGRIVDIFEAEGEKKDIALFFIHGGGWKGGSRTNHHFVIRELTRLGYDCASTDYRLNGVDVFGQVADVRTGLDFFVQDLARRKRPAKIVLYGVSAGAHLTMLTGLATPEECGKPATPLTSAYELKGIVVEACPFTFEPWEDIFPHIWTSMQGIAGFPYAQDPALYVRASPITYVRPGMPPIFAIHAGNEHMFPKEEGDKFAEKAKNVGARVEAKLYPKMEHGFFFALNRPQQRELLQDMLAFIQSLEAS